jgi:outer membrane immunogenic protein
MRKLVSLKTATQYLLTLAVMASVPSAALAQTGALEAGVDYNYVRTNAPTGDCGCFSLQGGNGWASFNFTRHLAIVGEVAAQHASDISGSGADLTLTSYLFGPRYTLIHAGRFKPFAQLLLGGAHASGSLAPGNSGLSGSANSFALVAGGGLDVGLTRHIALRLFEADYYLTRFDNGTNDHQNNLRIAAGLLLRFGGRK